MEMLNNRDKIFVCAHRGYMAQYPENSILAFKKALELEVDAIEMDLHYTKDHKIVIFHDSEIDRMTKGRGKIADFTFAQLQEFNLLNPDGSESDEKIPLFEDYLNLTQDEQDLIHIVEVKPQPKADDLFHEIFPILEERNLIDRTLLTTFDFRVTKAARAKGMYVQSFAPEKMREMDSNIDAEDYYALLDVIGLFIKSASLDETNFYKSKGLQFTLVPIDSEADIVKALSLGVNIFASNELEHSIAYRNSHN